MDKEYERIKASGLTGDALLTVLTEFELKNMNHFSSKVDLGGYYLLTGNFQLAENFFLRAVEVEHYLNRLLVFDLILDVEFEFLYMFRLEAV